MANRTVSLDLVGLDGNAFVLLGAFTRQARYEGWTDEEITAVVNEAKSDDYDHLVGTLDMHCEPTD